MADDQAEIDGANRAFNIRPLQLPPGQTVPFVVQQGPHGDQCTATAVIPRGHRILQERAFFKVKPNSTGNVTDRSITNAIREIQQTPRFWQFQALSTGFLPNPTDRDRFKINNILMEEEGDTRKGPYSQGIFLRASKFNHSCLPNGHMVYNKSKKAVTIHAVREIDIGEEIRVNYKTTETLATIWQRQSVLELEYDFLCDCVVCSPGTGLQRDFSTASEERRPEMAQLQSTLDKIFDMAQKDHRVWQVTDASKHALRFIKLANEEGFHYSHLAFADEILALDWKDKRDRHFKVAGATDFTRHANGQALSYAREALAWNLITSGEDSAVTRRVLQTLDKL